MALRKLTPEEDAVFEAIIQQRNSLTDDCFCYNFAKAEIFLCSIGASVRLGLGQTEQAAIIRKLTQDGLLNADWQKTDDDGAVIKGKFANDSDWVPSEIQLDSLVYDYGPDSLFVINISFKHIKTINEMCREKHRVMLSYDDSKSRFVIICAETGETLEIKKLKAGMRPHEVLKVAVQAPRTIITRDALNKLPNTVVHVKKDSIATQVFDDASIVRNELLPFVKLTNESIQVNPIANMTLVELEAIRQVCF